MKLFLLRNADTDKESDKNKALRGLSPAGEDSLNHLLDLLPAGDWARVAEIRHSPWVRAKQTAGALAKLPGLNVELREVPLLEPRADFRILADIVSGAEMDLILVGHEPSLGMLASYLLSQESQSPMIRLKKAGMLCLECVEKANAGNPLRNFWQLRWLISPKDFKK